MAIGGDARRLGSPQSDDEDLRPEEARAGAYLWAIFGRRRVLTLLPPQQTLHTDITPIVVVRGAYRAPETHTIYVRAC